MQHNKQFGENFKMKYQKPFKIIQQQKMKEYFI